MEFKEQNSPFFYSYSQHIKVLSPSLEVFMFTLHDFNTQAGATMCKRPISCSWLTAPPASAAQTSCRWRASWQESSNHSPALSASRGLGSGPCSTVKRQGNENINIHIGSRCPCGDTLLMRMYFPTGLSSPFLPTWMALS